MQCDYYDAGRCRSCTLIEQPYDAQLLAKEQHCRDLVPGADVVWLPPVAGPEQGFRTKAKMVAGGTLDEPTLGILDADGRGVDLRSCGLYPADLQRAFPVVAAFVTRAAITPYDVPSRTGELKHVLVTRSPDGELMVRFVLRSQEAVSRIRKHLPWLHEALPAVRVVSVNLLPEHRAVLEGEREILLTEASTLRMRVNDIDLHLRPQSFFQTNTDIAAALYRQAQAWVDALAPASVWDLYCGVGGFALHCARSAAGTERDVVGIETSSEAVASARLSARELGLTRVRFEAGDATAFALGSSHAPDLVVVNPPRRGIGPELSRWLEGSSVRQVVYSSCHAESLARDLAAMPSLRPSRAQLLDMFPQTPHYEVLTLLERR
ncbi:23S rRNA (uracil(747)-C(5))-methyltransferase RlmC [Cellulomonas soli]|uniref:23S rRNA (Uracil(747)-C(5))-methyltransferase RlmC n=1 Tax=Cellulomonas soli TaxID=931535 RepID=A0A512PAS5_9CELL|nr:23S rRNA (uracil(747)-C(5))-methyltransferase RlmC [Cellulomonas soli]NYI57406.1 23S rRNA (uracil747-C5)-methyltransferase [Cellulomonas soli]GEP68313.1 23S rRNA (uracil(747)-C(5))-methyltransferase RlmC [Cellulomonas soli]